MNTISIIYWLRLALGVTSGAICAAVAKFLDTTSIGGTTSVLLYTISLTLVIYLVTLRFIKQKFQNKVETPSKITMTGIGMYFFSWLATYVLFYTIMVTSL
jgi:hypothetical protein